MKDEIKSTEINVNKENIIPIADVKQESQCVLTLELYKDNVAFDITGQTVKLGAKTADGNVQLQESGFTINKNILTVDLKSSINSVVGLLEIDLTFTDSTGIMTTSSFYLNVIKKTLGKDNIIASNQLEAVKVLIEDLKTKGNNTIADIKKDYDSLKKVIIDNNAAANLQVQINENKQQLVENTNRIEQLEDLTPVWQEHEGTGDITVNDSFGGVAKDLVVKGRTLKNLVNNGENIINNTTSGKSFSTSIPMKPGSKYTVVLNVKEIPKTNPRAVLLRIHSNLGGSQYIQCNFDGTVALPTVLPTPKTGILKFKITIPSEWESVGNMWAMWDSSLTLGEQYKYDLMILEGNVEFNGSYFDSITSVGEQEDNKIKLKSVGKNLFNSTFEIGGITGSTGLNYDSSTHCRSGFIKVPKNSDITVSGLLINESTIFLYDSNKNYIRYLNKGDVSTYTISTDNVSYVRLRSRNLDNINNSLIMIEEGSVATNYEQYRAKLIEIPLPFAKGLKSTLDGTIYDEINISKGEIVQRVSEEYTELPKENIYKIPKDYLRFFNGTTNILQENNITSILKFEYPLNKDATIVSGLLINDILESEIKNNNNNISELNTKLTENKNDIDYLDSKITANTNNITTLNSKVTTNTNSINNLKTELAKHNIQTNPLWEGASFLEGGRELTLNKSLDNCRNGVVLVWSQYNTSTNEAMNERFAFVFIRKNTIVQNLNKPFGCLIANAVDRVSSYDHIITKYVNVSGTRVVGWRGNNQYQNAQSVLRAVYEW